MNLLLALFGKCPMCFGHGYVMYLGKHVRTCTMCNGTGQV